MESITKKSTEFQRKLSLLTKFMRKRGISVSLQLKVNKYFEYLTKEQNLENEVGDIVIKQLVGNLKEEVMHEIYGKMLRSQKIFKLNFSNELIDALSLQVKEIKLEP